VPAPGVDPGDHIEVRLQDRTDPAENPNLEFVIDDAARAVLALRDEGRRVLLHCVHGKSRTPTVAARYAVLRGVPVADALATVVSVLPGARANPTLRGALDRLGEPPGSTG
jgi:protein-tyrosine phosphatase